MEQDATIDAQKARELEARVKELSATVEELRSQLAWFRRNMFGRKSETMDFEPEEQVALELEDAMIEQAALPAPEQKRKGGAARAAKRGRCGCRRICR